MQACWFTSYVLILEWDSRGRARFSTQTEVFILYSATPAPTKRLITLLYSLTVLLCFALFAVPQEHFTQMRVVGQFNLGFMICLLGSDLFILDQHACDEKYNFEVLQKTTIIHQQPLVR